MGPTLLLDKSAFQALSQGEMLKISKYFNLNIVDILLWEIMGDFLKQTKTTSSRKEVSILADKISLLDADQNVSYIHLLVENLLGSHVTMDGRPIVAPDTITQLANGQTAAFIDYTRFCDMIHRWQQGNFTKEDIATANIWQDVKIDCKAKANNYLHLLTANHIVFPRCTDIHDMKLEVDKLLENINIQLTFLDMLLSYQGIESGRKQLINERIRQHPYSLPKAAPYAFYCMTVFAFYLGACKHDLLLERKPDDQIDLEYLFYLPFCKVFSSNDNFHKTLVRELIADDQVFVSGSELKKGILEIDIPPIHKETMNSKCDPIPPMAKHSLIRDIWISTKWLYN